MRTVKRIMAYTKGEAQYTPPDSVHGEGAALLKGMLVPAPEARVSLEQVLASNWFKMNLPRDFSPSKPTEPDPAFPQQSLAEVMVILERAVAMTDDVAAAQGNNKPLNPQKALERVVVCVVHLRNALSRHPAHPSAPHPACDHPLLGACRRSNLL